MNEWGFILVRPKKIKKKERGPWEKSQFAPMGALVIS
jgi:hypothetical protein